MERSANQEDLISVTVESARGPMPAKAKHLPWQQAVARYQKSDARRSIIQILLSIPPYFILWYLAWRSLEISYWLTLPITLLAGLFAMRCFIIFHDCGHGSFFKSRKWNDFWGVITGIITFTPYYAWRHSHAIHHASAGDLDRRDIGDVWTLTYDEYQNLPRLKKLFYRLYRNPFIIFVIGPTIDFVVLQRLPYINHSKKARERHSITFTNLALLAIVILATLTIGFEDYVLVQLPIIAFASSLGVFLFYVQHQFENVYWERHKDWDFATAALYGSSYFKMGPIMQFFTGNIGFHHIHHLSPRIPNYELEACHNSDPMFQEIEPLTWRTSLKSLRIRLWDESRHQVMGYHREDEEGETEPELNHDETAPVGGKVRISPATN